MSLAGTRTERSSAGACGAISTKRKGIRQTVRHTESWEVILTSGVAPLTRKIVCAGSSAQTPQSRLVGFLIEAPDIATGADALSIMITTTSIMSSRSATAGPMTKITSLRHALPAMARERLNSVRPQRAIVMNKIPTLTKNRTDMVMVGKNSDPWAQKLEARGQRPEKSPSQDLGISLGELPSRVEGAA